MPALTNPKHEKFAQLVATGSPRAAAHREVYGSKGRTAEVEGSAMAKKPEVSLRIHEIRVKYAERTEKKAEAQVEKRFLSIDERRAFLADLARTPVGEIDETSPLCQSVEYTEHGKKIKVPCKLRAIELDAKLAGELEPDGKTTVTVAVVVAGDELAQLQERRRQALDAAKVKVIEGRTL